MRIPKLRLFLVLLLAAAVVAGWFSVFPVPFKDVFGGSGEKVTDTSIIDKYRVDFALESSGQLTSTETLDVEFTQYGKHGIYRIFDTRDAQYRNVQHPVTVTSVDRKIGDAWQPEPYEVTQNGGGTMTIRIGSANRTFDPGIQKYRIVSQTNNALTRPKDAPEGAGSQWYWDVVGSGWAMPMRAAQVTAATPPTVAPPTCEASVPCTISDVDGAYRINLTDLPTYTPITMKAYFAEEAPGVRRTLRQNLILFATLALVGLSLALTGLTFARSREKRPTITPNFQPPGADPLVSTWTLQESPSDKAVPAVLLNLVAHGVVDFDTEQQTMAADGPAWIRLTRTDAQIPDLVGFPETLVALGLQAPGATRYISKSSVEDGKILSSLDGQISSKTSERIIRDGLATRVGGAGCALSFSFLAIIGGFSALIWLDSGLIVATLLLVAAVAGLLISGRDTTRLTDSGSAMRDATAGFKQVLSTPASVERFDYAARVRHFDDYLPWAVAFDCAEEWAQSCTPPPGSPEATAMAGTSHLYTSPTNTSAMWALSTGVVAVEASAVAAYQATQQSSSSGGGGGGGGGGGSGGGGGGSW